MKQQAKRRTLHQGRYFYWHSLRWRLLHHKHSGRLTPHATTSYPMLAMILLCVGVFLVFLGSYAAANPMIYSSPMSYTVNARVAGSAPAAATITGPADGQIFTKQPITVTGNCPANTYVKLFRNDVFSGVGLCQVDGSYSIVTDLFDGANQLRADVFNTADTPGPPSNIVTVYYQPPAETVATASPISVPTTSPLAKSATPKTSPSTAAPLLIKTNFLYTGTNLNQPASFQFDIEGGSAAYAISINWGDGQHDLLSRGHAGIFSISHTYQRGGGYKGSYVISLSASDSGGQQAYLQTLAIINNAPLAASGHINSNGGFGDYFQAPWQSTVWPAYGVVVLMLGSFWLGERRELHDLRRIATQHNKKLLTR